MEVDDRNPLDCAICMKTLEQPMLLPCGHTVCRSHETVAGQLSPWVVCSTCGLQHNTPEMGFPRNLMAENLLKRRLHNIYMSDEHKNSLRLCKLLDEYVDELRRIRQAPLDEVHRVVADLKNRIDLKREMCKQRIDDEAIELMRQLEEFETKRCLEQVTTTTTTTTMSDEKKSDSMILGGHTYDLVDRVDKLIDSYDREYVKWKAELSSFDLSPARCSEIRKRCDESVDVSNDLVERVRKSVFGDELYEYEIKIEKFGRDSQDALITNSFEVDIRLGCTEINSQGFYQFFTKRLRRFGLDWYLRVDLPRYCENHVGVYLHADPIGETIQYLLPAFCQFNCLF